MIIKILGYFLHIFEISVFGYFFYVSIYNLLLAIFGLKRSKFFRNPSQSIKKILIIVPAYKEDNVIYESVVQNLQVNYPSDSFEIIVIADSLQKTTLIKLKKLPIRVIEVSFDKSTKVKSINFALQLLGSDYDILIILDADNVLKDDFLSKVNELFFNGISVVQGRRIIKNPVNNLAFLDDLSEQINTHIFRRGTYNIGGSSSISGSGFAVDFVLGRKVFNDLDSIGGFDKEFELNLIEQGYSTAYCDDLIVFDEKVETNQVFKNQRKRWISSQLWILRKYFPFGMRSLFKGDYTYFNSAILRNIQLPRLLNLGLFTSIILPVFLSRNLLIIPFYFWVTIYSIFLFSLFFAIPKRFYTLKLLSSIFKLPAIFLTMFLLLFKLKGANQNFIHTPHNFPHKPNE